MCIGRVATRPVFAETSRFSACFVPRPGGTLAGTLCPVFLSILRGMIDILPSSQNTVIIFTYTAV